MSLPIRILSTDFDGTLHADHEDPPVPRRLQHLIAHLQASGMAWVINTGRDLSSLMETLGRAQLSIWPDYVVTVEREIYAREDSQYVGLEQWNNRCTVAHQELFARIRLDLPALIGWVKARYHATIYEDAYSPFCLIAQNNGDADAIHAFLEEYCLNVPNLAVTRNDIYARFSHVQFSKGSALAEIGRRLGASRESIIAAGDHLNDLSMLSRQHAKWLIAPGNAIPCVKEVVSRQDGFVSEQFHGHGVADGLERIMEQLKTSYIYRPALSASV
jgi:HAD superfamily hydrolase (TIGR01484 family)